MGFRRHLFLHGNGMGETNAAVIVDAITKNWLGTIGGVLAILGVIAAPITSGDTAFRSARLIVADFLKLEQKTVRRRLYISVPIFLVAIDCCCIVCAIKMVSI
jgi:carbon starvation protein CstA